MTKTNLLALALVASLSLPTLAHAGGFGEIFTPTPRQDSPSIDISAAFHSTDSSDPIDIKDVFHNTDDSDVPFTFHKPFKTGTGDIGLVTPPAGGVGTVKPGKAGSAQTAAVGYDKLVVMLDCVVAGTPSEFPDDLRITNAGPTTLPIGLRFKWQTQAPRLSGAAVLAAPLKAGKSVSLNGIFAGGLEAGTPCSVKAIGL